MHLKYIYSWYLLFADFIFDQIHKTHSSLKNLQVDPRQQRNMLSSWGSLLQREGRGQVWRGGRGRRRQGGLHQGLQRLRRIHQLRQQRGRRQRDGWLLQRVWQVCHHNGKIKIFEKFSTHSNSNSKSVITMIRYILINFQLIQFFFRFARKLQWLSLTQRLVVQARWKDITMHKIFINQPIYIFQIYVPKIYVNQSIYKYIPGGRLESCSHYVHGQHCRLPWSW